MGNFVSPENMWGTSPENSADGFLPHVAWNILDDFFYPSVEDSGDRGLWDVQTNANGKFDVDDSPGGVAHVKTRDASAADNDNTHLHSVAKSFKFASKPFWFETRIYLSDTATTAIVAGFSSDVADANLIPNGGAGVVANASAALIWRAKNGSAWNFTTSKGTTQEATTGIADAETEKWVRLGIRYEPHTAGRAKLIAYVNGDQVAVHTIDPDSAAEMYAIPAALKVGAAATDRVLVDYCKIVGRR